MYQVNKGLMSTSYNLLFVIDRNDRLQKVSDGENTPEDHCMSVEITCLQTYKLTFTHLISELYYISRNTYLWNRDPLYQNNTGVGLG